MFSGRRPEGRGHTGLGAGLGWWVLLVRAVLVLSLGVVLLASGELRPILGNMIAIYWLIDGILTLRWVRANSGRRSWPAISAGLVAVLTALVVLCRGLLHHVISTEQVFDLLGASFVITGVLRTSGVFKTAKGMMGRYGLGITEFLLGIVFISVTHVSRELVLGVGTWGLVAGTVMLIDVNTGRTGSTGTSQP